MSNEKARGTPEATEQQFCLNLPDDYDFDN